jgi:tetratricopeptide (TPR) repeat protein
MEEDTNNILETITGKLLPGHKPIDFYNNNDVCVYDDVPVRFAIWLFLCKNVNCIVTKRKLIDAFQGKIKLSSFFEKSDKKSTALFERDMYNYIRGICSKINKDLLNKKHPGDRLEPLACSAFIAVLEKQRLRLTTKADDILDAMERLKVYSQNDKERIALYDKVIERLESKPEKTYPYILESDKKQDDEEFSYEEYFKTIENRRTREKVDLEKWVPLDVIKINPHYVYKQVFIKSVDINDILKYCVHAGRNVIVFGECNAGKTYTCFKLFSEYREKHKKASPNSDARIPIYVDLSRLNGNKLDKITRGIIPETIFNRDRSNYIIFFDGLNESGDITKQQAVLREILNEFSDVDLKTRFFVTTQTIDRNFEKFDDFVFYRIQPLSWDSYLMYMRKWDRTFDMDIYQTYYNNLSAEVKKMLKNPAILNIFTSIIKNKSGIKIINPIALFQKYEKSLYKKNNFLQKGLVGIYRKHFLPYLAFMMCKENKRRLEWITFNKFITYFNEEFHSPINSLDVRNTLIYEFNILKFGDEEKIEFIQQTLKYYYAVRYIYEKKLSSDEVLKHTFTAKGNKHDMIAVIKMYVGIADPSIAMNLVKKVVKKDIFLSFYLFIWSTINYYDDDLTTLLKKAVDDSVDHRFEPIIDEFLFNQKVCEIFKNCKNRDVDIYAAYLSRLGFNYIFRANWDRSIELYENAILMYASGDLEDIYNFLKSFLRLGDAYLRKDNVHRAIECYKQAILIHDNYIAELYCGDDIRDWFKFLAVCFLKIACVYFISKDYDSTIDYLKKGMKIILDYRITGYTKDIELPIVSRISSTITEKDFFTVNDSYSDVISVFLICIYENKLTPLWCVDRSDLNEIEKYIKERLFPHNAT